LKLVRSDEGAVLQKAMWVETEVLLRQHVPSTNGMGDIFRVWIDGKGPWSYSLQCFALSPRYSIDNNYERSSSATITAKYK
jgi:hypothetical protein